MMNILLPTDFSENAWNAIAYAIKLHKDTRCTFHILNTYTPVIYHVEYVLINPAQYGIEDAVRAGSLESLELTIQRIIKEIGNNPNHKIETIARYDTLIQGIREVMEERKIDMIVMGTKGASGLKEIFIGSNTVHVLKYINCPVLAVPEHYTFDRPHEILFPTDYKLTPSPYNLKTMIQIAQRFTARVNVLHVSYGYALDEEQKKNKAILEELLGDTAHLFHDVLNDDVEDAINKFQIKERINLLAMVNNKHSVFENLLFQSKVNHIGFHLNIPFLVMPWQTD